MIININKTYQNVDPQLVHSELEAVAKMHGGKIKDKDTYARKAAGGGFQGNIVASFRTLPFFSSSEFPETEWLEGFKSRVIGQTDKCILRVEVNNEIIEMGTITKIEEDLNSVVGSWEVKED